MWNYTEETKFMDRSTCFAWALFVAGSAVLPACGSDKSTNQPASFSTGLNETESLSSLSDTDLATLCSKMGTYLQNDPAIEAVSCRLAGIGAAAGASFAGELSGTGTTDTDLEQACSGLESACKAKWNDPDAGFKSRTCTKPPGSCYGTVEDFETCVTDSLAALDRSVSKVPACSTLEASNFEATASSADAGTDVATPASCARLESECPGISKSTGLSSTASASGGS
jgi:hypothetical protein